MDKDSVGISFATRIHPSNNLAEIIFARGEDQRYKVDLSPGALTDFYENVSDSLTYRVDTKDNSDYGTIAIRIENIDSFPVIVQLLSEKNVTVDERLLTENSVVNFDYIKPGNYYIRIVFDTNSNGIWDTGNYLKRQQPEEIKYYPKKIEVRANWSLNETFILD